MNGWAMPKRWTATLLLTAGISALGSLSAHAVNWHSIFSDNPETYARPEAGPPYEAEVRSAVQARARGDLKGALRSFSAAATADVAESPNYELWSDIAELYCKTDKKREGRAMLGEYKCAIEVMAGNKKCWMNSEQSLEVPRKGVSPLCYAHVCNRAYEDLYWQGVSSKTLMAKFERQRRIYARLQEACR